MFNSNKTLIGFYFAVISENYLYLLYYNKNNMTHFWKKMTTIYLYIKHNKFIIYNLKNWLIKCITAKFTTFFNTSQKTQMIKGYFNGKKKSVLPDDREIELLPSLLPNRKTASEIPFFPTI